MIAVFYALRLSAWAVCMPAVLVATGAVAIGYVTSSVVAPAYVGQMHDVIYVIRNSLNHRMLEPATFYTFDNGARTLYFQRWLSDDVVANMFIQQVATDTKEKQIITAAQTEFRRNDKNVLMIMSHGSIQDARRWRHRDTDHEFRRIRHADRHAGFGGPAASAIGAASSSSAGARSWPNGRLMRWIGGGAMRNG